jgi:hypothetical protein
MPAFLGLGADNAVAWASFHRRGGLRTVLALAGPYFAIMGGLIYLVVRVNPNHASSTYAGWANALLGLQFVFAVLIGAGRVSAGIRGDVASGMMESLRMMPLPARHAIAGYLSSAMAQMSGFFAANFLLGFMVNTLAQLPAQRWVVANVIILAFGVFVWTLAAFLSLAATQGGAVLVIMVIVGVAGNAALVQVAPGLAVFAGSLIGGAVFDARTELVEQVVLSLAAQVLVGSIFFAGAARKYRRPDGLALGGTLSVGLLLAVVGVSLMALLWPEVFEPTYLRGWGGEGRRQVAFAGSTIGAMLVALVPLANLARLHVAWVRGRRDDPTLRRAAPPMWVSALGVTAVMALMLLGFPTVPDSTRAACVVAALFGFGFSVIFVAGWFYRSVESAKVILAIWLGIYCLLPLVLHFLVSQAAEFGDEPSTLAAFSPMGMVSLVGQNHPERLIPAAVCHVLAPVLPIALYWRVARGRRRGEVAAAMAVG